MHQAQSYIDGTILHSSPGIAPTAFSLTPAFVAGLRQSLTKDAVGLCYSGAISIAEGARGIDSELYTWATVKLYYSTFYLARALLALKGVAIFYANQKPLRWVAQPGEVAKRLKGTSHAVVLNEFENTPHFAHLAAQQIAAVSPLEWLREQREAANYKNPRFHEPAVPPVLGKIQAIGVRKAIEAYVADTQRL